MRKALMLGLFVCIMLIANVTLTFAQPDIELNPDSLDFESVYVGEYAEKILTVGNIGDAVLNVFTTGIADDPLGQFSIEDGGAPFTVEPQQSHLITYRFTPQVEGEQFASYTLTTDSPDEESIDKVMWGTGIIEPDIKIEPESLEYGTVDIGTTVYKSLFIKNVGNGDLTVTNITWKINPNNQFVIESGGATPIILTPNSDPHEIEISFTPDTSGKQTAYLDIISDDPDEGLVRIKAWGTGFEPPDIAVDPTSWDFGIVDITDFSDKTFVVTNEGGSTLEVSSTDLDNPDNFSIQSGGGSFSLGPDETHEIVVRFQPIPPEGPKSTTLSIVSNDSDEEEVFVHLQGIGNIPPDIAIDPESLDYGTFEIGEYETEVSPCPCPFEVSNEGGGVLVVSEVTLTGTNPDEFYIVSGDETPFSLSPGDPLHEIVVCFKPIDIGEKSAYLTIISNDPDENPLDVPLSGRAELADMTPPEIIMHNPPDGSILDIEPYNVRIEFSEPMNTESVLKTSEFVRINITDGVTEMRASICTFLYWFGHPDQAAKYESYGCGPGPYGVAECCGEESEADNIDVTFSGEDDRSILDIEISDPTIGRPQQHITEDTEYRLTILINYAMDDAGNTLELKDEPPDVAGINYTYFLTQQEPVTIDEQSLTLLHDDSLTVNIPAGALSEGTTLTAYTYFPDSDGILPRWDEYLPSPLWAEFGKIGFIKAFHLELEAGSITSPIEIQVQYDDSDVPVGYEESPRLYQKDGEDWVLLVGSGDPGSDRVFYDGVTELGDFAVMWGYPYGDVNNPVPDGVINLLDAQAIVQDWVGYRPIWDDKDPDMSDIVANVNGDGTVDLLDAQVLVQIWVGLLDHPPVLDSLLAPINISYSPNVTHTAFLSRDTVSNRVSFILDNATDVFSADVELTYDARLLKVFNVSQTSLTSESVIEYNDKNVGKLRFALVNGLALSGAGSLADVQFELMSGASSAAAFESIKLTKVELNAGLIKTTLGKVPQRLALLQNYPNPFNPETWIPYELNQPSDVEVLIYNINGQVVRRLRLGQQIPGSYITKDKAAYWDGVNAKGEKVSSGVYFYQLKAGEKSLIRKMVIMK